jgi:hypothetical protein
MLLGSKKSIIVVANTQLCIQDKLGFNPTKFEMRKKDNSRFHSKVAQSYRSDICKLHIFKSCSVKVPAM